MGSSSPRGHVLVVEDEPDISRLIASALGEVRYVALEAMDGAAALAECRRRDPDVIVLDLELPGMDSSKFIEEYRRLRGRARLVVVSATPRGAENAAKLHADVFLSKPFSIVALVAAVRRQAGEDGSI